MRLGRGDDGHRCGSPCEYGWHRTYRLPAPTPLERGPPCATPADLRDALRVKPGIARPARQLDPAATHGFDKASAEPATSNASSTGWPTSRTGSGPRRKQSVLVVLQGIDAAGKDGTIKKVMEAFNPQGCAVSSFKVPTPEELGHDFLWRIHKRTPAQGRDRHLQPLALRGRAGRPRPRLVPKASGRSATTRSTPSSETLADERHDDRQVLPDHRSRRAAGALPGALRRPDQALEVLDGRPRGAQAAGTTTRPRSTRR